MKTKEEIIEEFEEKFGGYVLSNDKGIVTDLGIQDFILKALSQQKQEIIDEIDKLIKGQEKLSDKEMKMGYMPYREFGIGLLYHLKQKLTKNL